MAVAGPGFVRCHGTGGGCVMAAVAPQAGVAVVPADPLAEDNLVAALLFAVARQEGTARAAGGLVQARGAACFCGCCWSSRVRCDLWGVR